MVFVEAFSGVACVVLGRSCQNVSFAPPNFALISYPLKKCSFINKDTFTNFLNYTKFVEAITLSIKNEITQPTYTWPVVVFLPIWNRDVAITRRIRIIAI